MVKDKIPDWLKENFKDKEWRMNNLYFITNKQSKKILFKKNWAQHLLGLSPNHLNMTLKARQLGVSTYYLINQLDNAIWNENWRSKILSHKQESLEELFTIVRYAYENMHPLIRPRVDKGGGSKYRLHFPIINSTISVGLEHRSGRLNELHVSEYGLMKSKDAYNASVDAVPEGGPISIESTPLMMNHFYDDWFNEKSEFKKHFFPWFMHPEYKIPLGEKETIFPSENEISLIEKAIRGHQITISLEQLKWRRSKISKKGIDSFLSEYPEDDQSCFLSSGDPALDLYVLKDWFDKLEDPSIVDEIEFYEEFDKSENYVCGVDTAGGRGGDYYVATVYRVRDYAQCAQFRTNRMRSKPFAEKTVKLCGYYKKPGNIYPLLGVERNNHGHSVISHLIEDFSYTNLYYYKDDAPGWDTNILTRPIMIDAFREAFDSGMLKPRSKNLLMECKTLVKGATGKIEAATGCHDDCVIASAIAIQMVGEHRSLSVYDDIESKIIC